jgi:hypothetical protein
MLNNFSSRKGVVISKTGLVMTCEIKAGFLQVYDSAMKFGFFMSQSEAVDTKELHALS